MKIGSKTDNGKVREQNEDAYGYKDNLFIVADGMGGHQAGEIASAITVQTILNSVLNPQIETGLKEVILQANQAILNEVSKHQELQGMGTTVAVLVIMNDLAYITHVGDSRIYRLSGGRLVQLTVDHSLVAELVRTGGLTEEQAKTHPQRNILTKALGTDGALEFEVNTVPVLKGDKFLLCSDGLTGMIDKTVLAEIISLDQDPQVIVENLISTANNNGGTDNITVILIEV
jgi:PPM family protein phosphatase